jgi:hypothetical protein
MSDSILSFFIEEKYYMRNVIHGYWMPFSPNLLCSVLEQSFTYVFYAEE